MKIAIISMQRVVNFGSVLQAYSLRDMIREVTGVEPCFVDIEDIPALNSRHSVPESVDYLSPAIYPAGLHQKAKRRLIAILSSYNKCLIRRFMKKELKLDESNNKRKYDYIVVGSDEVFNHSRGIRLQLHGEVRQADKVLTYAASCGSAVLEDIDDSNLARVKAAMANFSVISVRDDNTEKYASALYYGKVQRHLDPVLVGDLAQRPHRPVGLKKYLLVYAYGQRIRSEEEITAIRKFAADRKLKVVAMGGSQFWCDFYLPTSPTRILDYFFYADYVVTDTFHGAIFSVINKKKFALIQRQTNKNKLSSLMSDLGLEDHMITDVSGLETTLVRDIDYGAVELVLQRERERTREYLRQQLGENFE